MSKITNLQTLMNCIRVTLLKNLQFTFSCMNCLRTVVLSVWESVGKPECFKMFSTQFFANLFNKIVLYPF